MDLSGVSIGLLIFSVRNLKYFPCTIDLHVASDVLISAFVRLVDTLSYWVYKFFRGSTTRFQCSVVEDKE